MTTTIGEMGCVDPDGRGHPSAMQLNLSEKPIILLSRAERRRPGSRYAESMNDWWN
jgi:hypothetical protein